VFLAIESFIVDDDALGASHGDGDGIIEYDETIELGVLLHNMGHLDGHGITADLSALSPYVGMLDGTVDYGEIPSGATSAGGGPFVFHVTHDVPNGQPLAWALAVNAAPHSLPFELVARAPAYVVEILELDDSSGGNGDGIADPGETVELTLLVANVGGCDSPPVTGELQSGTPYLTVAPGPHELGVVGVGQQVVEGGFSVTVDPACPPVQTPYLRLVFAGPAFYAAAAPFLFSVGQVFADDMETGGESWTHYAGPGNWIDEWHLETFRNHTYTGQTSWKCGGAGGASYGGGNYALLESAPIDLPEGACLRFWHWMRAEVSQVYPGYCFDGGLLQISNDSGATWVALEPEGGYPFRIRASSGMGPFPGETPVWSGDQGWNEVSVDLSAHAGDILLRWAFGSSASIGREGWYIDDVRIVMPPMSGLPGKEARVIRPVLFPVAPNPFAASGARAGSAAAAVRFVLPGDTWGSLAVFDACGRRVCSLIDGRLAAGEHHLAWDGRDAAGRPVAAGAYYCRLSAGRWAMTQRITLVR
jgi:hypothetical protein